MPTFLTTKKMSPELAARVEASVRGRRGRAGEPKQSRWKPIVVGVARVGAALAVGAIACSVVLARQRDQTELERARQGLMGRLAAASRPLSPEDLGAAARMESWLVRASGAYEGDLVADELHRPGALAALLARPAVYVHGAVAEARVAAKIADVAAASVKDAFLVCLLEPPSARTEKALLSTVHDVYAGGAEPHSPQVRRLRDAEVGLPFLTPLWADNVRLAKTHEEIDALGVALDKAPLEYARRAAKADLFVFALDEEGEKVGPAELDGERPHPVRVELVDLAASKVLLRMRKHVDPTWISITKRSLYASGLDQCALAFDVRASITP